MSFVKDAFHYKTTINKTDTPCEVKIGNPLGNKFIPQVDLSKWEGEAWLSVSFPAIVSTNLATYDAENDRITLAVGNYTFRWYLHPDENLEFEIILASKPTGGQNSFTFNLDFPVGLEFYYQPELTQAEIDAGFVRPENVVGSYAVYWNKRNNAYRTGKLCHIYRPKLTDALGKTLWGTLSVDPASKTMTITADATWLKNAAYPVVIDPTFGENAGGASTGTFIDYIVANVAAPANGNGTADYIGFYYGTWAGGGKIKGALYLNSDKSLLTPQTEQLTAADGNPTPLHFTGGPIVTNGTNYAISVWNQISVTIQYDSGGAANANYYQLITYGTWPNPASFTSIGNIYSIFCSYTPSVGEVSISVSDSLSFAEALD